MAGRHLDISRNHLKTYANLYDMAQIPIFYRDLHAEQPLFLETKLPLCLARALLPGHRSYSPRTLQELKNLEII